MASAGEQAVKKAIEAGEVKQDSTQTEVKEWKAKHNAAKAASKPTIVPDYKVVYDCLGFKDTNYTHGEVDRVALASPKDFPETAKLKPITVVKSVDEDGEEFYTAIMSRARVMTYKVERLAKETKKPSKPDFSNFDDAAFAELLKEAARRGMKVE